MDPKTFTGKTFEQALDIIDKDIEYTANYKFYWLWIPQSFDNVIRYIRFPYGQKFSMELDLETDIIKNVWIG